MEKVKVREHVAMAGATRLMPPIPPAPTVGWAHRAPALPGVKEPRSLPTVGPSDPAQVLELLVADVDGVRGAILASVDGFGVARSNSMADEPSHPAMLAAAVGLAHQLAAMGGGQHLRQLVVDHDGGLMLVWPIGPDRVLAVLASATVEQRRVRSLVHSHADSLAVAPEESS